MAKTKQATIILPKKVLREGLQKRKREFEKKGWTFEQGPLGLWSASIMSDGVLHTIERNVVLLSDLMDEIASMDEIAAEFAPKISLPTRAINWLTENYFSDSEIEKAKISPDPTKFLQQIAQNSGRGLGHDKIFCTTKAGFVEVEIKNESGEKEAVKISLKTLSEKAVETFEKRIEKSESAKSESAKIFSPDTVKNINLSEIVPSPFEPQKRRRARFKPDELASLGNSITLHGLVQPILVRPRPLHLSKKSAYEIVFGERRFLAARLKNLDSINCFVRTLTDAEVLELQYEENHRRQESHPLDDAFLFKYLKQHEGFSDSTLADKFGTTEKNIVNKLKLNDLIPEAVLELESGKLPLKHAYYLAKFPAATQKTIVAEKYAYGYDEDNTAVSFAEFREEIEEHIVRRLDTASFDTEDERLHILGLKCSDCVNNTAFAPMLFPELATNNSCLDKTCFEVKTNTNLKLTRMRLAAALPNPENLPAAELEKQIPLVTERAWSEKTPFGREKPLTGQKFLNAPECEYSTVSLIIEGARKGESIYICQNKSCEIHNPPPPDSSNEAASRVKEKEETRQIENSFRKKVLYQGCDFFSDTRVFWLFDDLVKKLIVEFWQLCDFSKKLFICKYLGIGMRNAPAGRVEFENHIAGLDKKKQSAVLFLLINNRLFESHFDNLGDLDEIRRIAADYAGTDYRELFAEAMLELAASREDKELAEDILTITRAGVRDLRPPDFDLGEKVH